jgi:peptidoglycan/LPS O-acetylase OafA/YrhL
VPPLLAAWAIALAGLQWVPATGPWSSLLTSPLAFEFIAGAAAGLYWRRLRPCAAALFVIVATLAMLAGCWTLMDSPNNGQAAWPRTLAFGLPAALLIAGVARLESVGKLRVPRLVVALGDASYSLYLTHLFVLSICGRVWTALGQTGSIAGNIGFLLSSFAACCIVALITHRLVERPLLRLAQRRPSRAGPRAGEAHRTP